MNTYLVIAIVVLVVMIAVAISFATRARSLAVQDELLPDDELAEFTRMREAGEISEEEFRKMKKIIAEKTVKQARGE